jgi:hypothetical protein
MQYRGEYQNNDPRQYSHNPPETARNLARGKISIASDGVSGDPKNFAGFLKGRA